MGKMRLIMIAGTLLTLLVLVLLAALACLRFGMCTGITGITSNATSMASTVPMGVIVLSILAIVSGLAIGFLIMRPHSIAKKIPRGKMPKAPKPLRAPLPPKIWSHRETKVPKPPKQKITKPFKFKLFTLKKKKKATKQVAMTRLPKAPRPLKVPAVPKFAIEETPAPIPILKPHPQAAAVPKQISQIQQRLEMIRQQMESRPVTVTKAPEIARVPGRIIRTLPPITKISPREEMPAPAERPSSPISPALARLQERISAMRHEVALPPVETRPKLIEDLEKIAKVKHKHHVIKKQEKKRVKKVSKEALEDIEGKLGKL